MPGGAPPITEPSPSGPVATRNQPGARRDPLLAAALPVLPAFAASPPAAEAPIERFVEVEGKRLRYVDAGRGPPVVLLHGLGSDSSRWSATMQPLADAGFRAIALDMIGFGGSDRPALDYRMSLLADHLEGFLDALGIDRAILVGNSLGGWTAAELALTHPDRVQALVLVDAGYGYAAGTDPVTLPRRAMPASPDELRAVLSLMFHDRARFVSDVAVERAWAANQTSGDRHVMDSLVASIARREDVLDGRLGAITLPTLVIAGREDRLTPLPLSERMAHEIPGAQLVVLERCGHVPSVECPEAFNAALLRFLGTRAIPAPSFGAGKDSASATEGERR